MCRRNCEPYSSLLLEREVNFPRDNPKEIGFQNLLTQQIATFSVCRVSTVSEVGGTLKRRAIVFIHNYNSSGRVGGDLFLWPEAPPHVGISKNVSYYVNWM